MLLRNENTKTPMGAIWVVTNRTTSGTRQTVRPRNERRAGIQKLGRFAAKAIGNSLDISAVERVQWSSTRRSLC